MMLKNRFLVKNVVYKKQKIVVKNGIKKSVIDFFIIKFLNFFLQIIYLIMQKIKLLKKFIFRCFYIFLFIVKKIFVYFIFLKNLNLKCKREDIKRI